jgi:hypothetical protein
LASNCTFFEQYSSTLRPNPLFSGMSSSGEQEIYARASVNGVYSTLLSPTRATIRQQPLLGATAPARQQASSGGGSSGTASHEGTWAVQQGTLGGAGAANLDAFSQTMTNPIFRGRAMLDFISRHSSAGSHLSSAGGSAAGAQIHTGTLTTSAAAAAQAKLAGGMGSAAEAGSKEGGKESGAKLPQTAASAAATGNTVFYSAISNSARSDGASSSHASDLAHSLASTGFSTDSEALGHFVTERVATDNFVITTETAPNTSHFRGKHLKATAARSGGSGVDSTCVITEEDDYEVEFSEDGQASPAFNTATEQAIQAELERQQQQQDNKGQQRRWEVTERLPGDFIYEMLPGVDDAMIWSTLPYTARYGQTGGDIAASSSSIYGRSALADTLSGYNGSSAVPVGSSYADALADSKAWMYGTGGFFAGLKGVTFGFMGTIGSLRSTAASSLRSEADLGATGGLGGADNLEGMVQEMSKAQVKKPNIQDQYGPC